MGFLGGDSGPPPPPPPPHPAEPFLPGGGDSEASGVPGGLVDFFALVSSLSANEAARLPRLLRFGLAWN